MFKFLWWKKSNEESFGDDNTLYFFAIQCVSKAKFVINHHPQSDKNDYVYEDDKLIIAHSTDNDLTHISLKVKNGSKIELLDVLRSSVATIERFNRGNWVGYLDELYKVAKEAEDRKEKLLWEPVNDAEIFKRPD